MSSKVRKTEFNSSSSPSASATTRHAICIADSRGTLDEWSAVLLKTFATTKLFTWHTDDELSITNDACWDDVQRGIAVGKYDTLIVSVRLKTFNIRQRDYDGASRYGRKKVPFSQKEPIRAETLAIIRILGLATSFWNRKLTFFVQIATDKNGVQIVANLEEAKLLFTETPQEQLRLTEEEVVVSSVPGICRRGSLGPSTTPRHHELASLTLRWICACPAKASVVAAESAVATEELRTVSEDVVFTTPLRQDTVATQAKETENLAALGGLRDAHKAVQKLPAAAKVGKELHTRIAELLVSNPQWVTRTIDVIGKDESAIGIIDEPVRAVRTLLCDFLGCKNDQAISNEKCSTSIRAHLLEAWRALACDPDDQVFLWLTEGTPAGIRVHPVDRGIFPSVDAADEWENGEDLVTPDEEFTNYSGIDEDEFVWDEIEKFENKGYVTVVDSLDAARHALGSEDPVFSKLGLIVKERDGKVKKRLIVDSKQSRVKHASLKAERIVLPRVRDVINAALFLLSLCTACQTLSFFVLDFTEAFWQLPLAPVERRFFVARFRRKMRQLYIIFLRLAQGSRNAPLCWGRVGALLMRLTQSLFPLDVVRLACFVDDPIAVIRGTESEQQLIVCIIVLVWAALGFPLALPKGQYGKRVRWIGFDLSVDKKTIVATLKEELVRDIKAHITSLAAVNIVPHKLLRSFAGKVSHAASLLYTLRPFLAEIWAALVTVGVSSGAPPNTVWFKQIRSAITWFQAFFDLKLPSLTRTFHLSSYLSSGPHIEIGVDASPWGIGAWLSVNHQFVRWLATPLDENDLKIFDLSMGDPAGQQVWEALGTLVSLRAWLPAWRAHRVAVRIRGDNVTMLKLLLAMRPSGWRLALIAREVALDVAAGVYTPGACVHTPGLAHKAADGLSRKFAPGVTWSLPICLQLAEETKVPPRTECWYRARSTSASHVAVVG